MRNLNISGEALKRVNEARDLGVHISYIHSCKPGTCRERTKEAIQDARRCGHVPLAFDEKGELLAGKVSLCEMSMEVLAPGVICYDCVDDGHQYRYAQPYGS